MFNVRWHIFVEKLLLLKPANQALEGSLVTVAKKVLQMGKPPLKRDLWLIHLIPGFEVPNQSPHTLVLVLDHIKSSILQNLFSVDINNSKIIRTMVHWCEPYSGEVLKQQVLP